VAGVRDPAGGREGYTVILDAGNNLLSPLSMRAINLADNCSLSWSLRTPA